MKKILLFLIFPSLIMAQELKLTSNGIEPIVVEVEGMQAEQIYNQALLWVQETYKNPSHVLKANVPNEKIRIEGFSQNAFSFTAIGMKSFLDVSYTLEISFKDEKYKFDYIVNKISSEGKTMAQSFSVYYKKDGQIRKMYSEIVPTMEGSMNNLHQSFYNYVTGLTQELKSDW